MGLSVCVLGSINLDIVQRVDQLPRPGETILSRSVDRLLGGKGANQAVAAARMGVSTRLLAAVGLDADGDDLLARLASYGVDVSQVERSALAVTGAAYICVSQAGENMIVVASGANAALDPQSLRAGTLDGSDVYLAQLETPLATVRALFDSARARTALRILNAAPAIEEALDLFGLADILVVNEVELAVFARLARPPATPGDAEPAALGLIQRDGQTVIVTLGAAGALAVARSGSHWIPGIPAKAVDTTGAGDCFCGVLAACLSLGEDLPHAVARANAAASLSVRRHGASSAMPGRAEVDALLAL